MIGLLIYPDETCKGYDNITKEIPKIGDFWGDEQKYVVKDIKILKFSKRTSVFMGTEKYYKIYLENSFDWFKR